MRPSSRVDMSGLCDDADRGIPEFPAWDSQINNYSKSSLSAETGFWHVPIRNSVYSNPFSPTLLVNIM